MTSSNFSNTIATLVTNGFHLTKIDRISATNYIFEIYKFDKLGAEVRYCLLFSEDKFETSVLDMLISVAKRNGANPILINDSLNSTKCPCYTNELFFDLFGGIINTGLILIPNLSEILDKLGHNKRIENLEGDPDDLHEIYVRECLQFLMVSPSRRYGKDRLFESLPDVVVLNKDGFMILIDSKAYEKGFDFTSDDIKRFASYVKDFDHKYSQYFGNVFTFLVISGHFNDSYDSIENRSNELYKLCHCKLSCIKSSELAEIVQLLQTNPEIRGSINWQNILTELIIEKRLLRPEINRITKDKIH